MSRTFWWIAFLCFLVAITIWVGSLALSNKHQPDDVTPTPVTTPVTTLAPGGMLIV